MARRALAASLLMVAAACGESSLPGSPAPPTRPAVSSAAPSSGTSSGGATVTTRLAKPADSSLPPTIHPTLPGTLDFANTTSLAPIPLTSPAERSAATLETGERWCPGFRSASPAQTAQWTEADWQTISAVAERNLGAINAYVGEHIAEAGTPWLDSANDPAQVVIGFTAHVADHRLALAAVVNDPDRVLVCQIRHAQPEIVTASTQIQTMMTSASGGGGFRAVGAGIDSVGVELAADQEALAAELVTRYGDLVSIKVGLFPYPMPTDRRSLDTPACAASIAGPTTMQGLQATVSLAANTVRRGEDVKGTVTITNHGDAPVSFFSGATLVGSVVRAGTTTVVGIYAGGVDTSGHGGLVEPGKTDTLEIIVGTASCDPAMGYALAPGHYQVVVPVIVNASAATPVNELVSLPADLTVTD